jgi:Zn-dependent M28 family amino/carboxypeptidase
MRPLLSVLAAAALLAGCSRTASLEEARTRGLGEVAAAVDPARVWAYTEGLVAAHRADTPVDCRTFMEFDPESPGCNLTRDAARVYLRGELEALGYRVVEQEVAGGTLRTTNLVAERRGTQHPGEVVLVGAHFDAFFAAADDNSTGVAVMLELARVLSTRPLARTVRFVGFDLEELGLTGSTRYVQGGAKDDAIVASIILDSVGFRRREPSSQTAPTGLSLPTTADFLAVIANAQSTPHADEVWLLNQRLSLTRAVAVEAPGRGDSPLTGDLLRSDHGPFWLADKPALFFTDTTQFRNAHYHTPGDTLETLDRDFLAEVTRLAAVATVYWAGGLP